MNYVKLFFFSLVLMSFFVLSKVNAESCTQTYQADLLPTLNVTQQLNKGLNSINANFSNNIVFNGSQVNYIKLHTYYLINDTTGTLTNINMTATCAGVSTNSNFSNPSYIITYADGTQARVSGVEYDSICASYNVSGGNAVYSYQPEITNFHVALVNNYDQYFMCDTDNNGIAKCPINGTMTIKAIRFYTTLSNKDTANAKFGLVTRFIGYCNDDTQTIINNQNQNQQQAHQDAQDINNSINNNNVSGANNDANSFVNNQAFQDNTGLTSVITAPLSVVNSLTATCSPIRLTLPYIDTNIDIPCIGSLLEQKVGALAQLIKVVVNGFICYIIGVDLFRIVKVARNPDDDRIEVLDL